MELSQIARILKEHEGYCYQVAYFLLQQEDVAVLATERALLELGRSRCFLSESAEERRHRAKRVAAKHSLRIRLTSAEYTAPAKVETAR